MKNFGEMSWQEFGHTVPAHVNRVLLPVGTLEAHGVTPLATDNIIPEHLCKHISGDLHALVAPTINYGITRSLSGFPGSFGVRPEIFRAYVVDVLCGLSASGFERVAIINGHGGNNGALKEAAWEFYRTTGKQVCVVHWWMFCNDICRQVFGQDGGHAGCDETAMVMAADPEYVKSELYDDALAFEYHSAVDMYPAPSSIMLYTPGEGNPVFDRDKCLAYADQATDKVKSYLLGLWDAWDRMLKPAQR